MILDNLTEGGVDKKRGFVIVFIAAVALAWVIGVWWLQQPPKAIYGQVAVNVAYASPGTTGCAACHTSAIAYNDCMQCHTPTINYTKPPKQRAFYLGHHDPDSTAIIPPAVTVLESCTDVACHNASASDARYVTARIADHTYCEQCHIRKGNCGFCHT
jgi:hypothetical protein